MKVGLRKLILLCPFLFLAVLSIGSGCPGGREAYPKPEDYPELEEKLDRYIASIQKNTGVIDNRMEQAAKELAKVSGKASVSQILQKTFDALPVTVCTAYYNKTSGQFLTAPLSSPDITPEMLEVPPGLNRDRIVVHGPFETTWNDVVLGVSLPVYAADGSETGRAAVFLKVYNLFAGSAQISGLDGYYPGVSSSDGTIVFSRDLYKIGSGLHHHNADIVYRSSSSGEYYRSGYDAILEREVLISSLWKTVDLNGARFSVSLGVMRECRDPDAVPSEAELIRYVESLREFAVSHSPEETFAFISKEMGLSSEVLFPAFAVDFSGRILAMAGKTDVEGVRLDTLCDAYEMNGFSEMRIRALQGGGSVHFFAPVETNEGLLSLAYVLPIAGKFLVGAAIPCKRQLSQIQPDICGELYAKAEEVSRYQDANGKAMCDKAVVCEVLPLKKDMVVNLMSLDGISRGQNGHPETVGIDVLDTRDCHGNAIAQEMIHLAKHGGGRLYYCYTNTAGVSTLYLTRVLPLATDGLVAVSLPVERKEE